MIDKICVIVPTRNRLIGFKIFANSWKKTTEGKSVVVVGYDDDDHTYDEMIAENKYPFIWDKGKSKPCLLILSELAVKYAKEYKYVAFMEDDTLFNTPGWETPIINKLEELGENGIVWCNDLLVRDKLIALPFMNSSIVTRLGYMSPPVFRSQGPDWYWTDIGRNLGTCHYFPDIVTEHRHHTTGKTLKDETTNKIHKEEGVFAQFWHSPAYMELIREDLKKLRGEGNYEVKQYST